MALFQFSPPRIARHELTPPPSSPLPRTVLVICTTDLVVFPWLTWLLFHDFVSSGFVSLILCTMTCFANFLLFLFFDENVFCAPLPLAGSVRLTINSYVVPWFFFLGSHVRQIDPIDHDLDHVDPAYLAVIRHVVQDLYGTDPTQETCPRSTWARSYRSYRSGTYLTCLADLDHAVGIDHADHVSEVWVA